MVLRGSKLKPKQNLEHLNEELTRIKEEVSEIQNNVNHLTIRLREIGKKINEEKGFTPELKLNFGKCLDSFDALDSRLSSLYNQKIETESSIHMAYTTLLSGGLATSIARNCVAPLDRIKLQLQITNNSNANVQTVFNEIVAKEGIIGFWRGNFMNCIRVFPKGGFQFTIYDQMKPLLERYFDEHSYICKLLSGATSAIIAETFTYPLDVLRMRLIKNPGIGIMDLSRQLYSKEGIYGFLTGYQASLYSLVPFISLNFATHDYLKTQYSVMYDKKPSSVHILGFGCISAGSSSLVCYPLDTVRRRLMVTEAHNQTHSFTLIKTLIKTQGVRSVYKGFFPSLVKIAPQSGLRFLCFEKIKELF